MRGICSIPAVQEEESHTGVAITNDSVGEILVRITLIDAAGERVRRST